MDITCVPNLRDRRIAASDERRRSPRARILIRAIILHQTSGPSFLPLLTSSTVPPTESRRRPAQRGPYPADSTDSDARSDHRIDQIAAHFVIIEDGTIFYTHDIERLSGSVGARHGIDIEFAGTFDREHRLPSSAIQRGRQLIRCLTSSIPRIEYIHPHGQIQSQLMDGRACGGDTGIQCGKLHSCPGPDIWVNVGMWATDPTDLNLRCNPPLPYYQNNEISSRQQDSWFDQHII